MVVSDTGSMSARSSDSALLRGLTEVPHAGVCAEEPEIVNKWHPRWTLAFIVASCTLLWAGIFAAVGLLF